MGENLEIVASRLVPLYISTSGLDLGNIYVVSMSKMVPICYLTEKTDR